MRQHHQRRPAGSKSHRPADPDHRSRCQPTRGEHVETHHRRRQRSLTSPPHRPQQLPSVANRRLQPSVLLTRSGVVVLGVGVTEVPLARLRKGSPGSSWRRCASRPRENAAGKRNAEKSAVRPVLHDCHPRDRKRNAKADQPGPRAVAAAGSTPRYRPRPAAMGDRRTRSCRVARSRSTGGHRRTCRQQRPLRGASGGIASRARARARVR